MKDLCGLCHQVTEPYLTSKSGKSMLCESCTEYVQRKAPAINREKWLGTRPSSPYEKPKLDVFQHGLPND